MANHTTGAQRRNARMERIFEEAKRRATYAISYRNDPADPTKYNGLWSIPGTLCFESVIGADGKRALFDTPYEAEAKAAHVLCSHLNRRA